VFKESPPLRLTTLLLLPAGGGLSPRADHSRAWKIDAKPDGRDRSEKLGPKSWQSPMARAACRHAQPQTINLGRPLDCYLADLEDHPSRCRRG